MGSLQATEFANSELAIEDQLAWHLRSNCFPPVPLFMIQPCIEAIDACNAFDPQAEISLPEQTSWRGKDTAPAREIVNSLRLDAWLIEEEY